MGKLFEELKRRKVVRVGGVYAVVAWLLIQVTNNIVPALQMPPWTSTFIVVFLLIGFPIALVLAWAYELAPDGTRADSADPFSPAAAIPSSDRKLIYATFALVLLVAVFQIADRFLAPAQQSTANQSASANNGAASEADRIALPETRVDIVTPASALPADFALSPDGRQIVFVASDDSGTSQLWLRPLATTTAQPLARTEGALAPFWSPDSRSVGFFIGSDLKRLDIGGGAPQTLARTGGPVDVTWGTDNTLLFSPNPLSPLVSMSAAGGALTAMTTLAPQQYQNERPYFLPDGRRFLFTARGTPDTEGIYLGFLDGSTAPVRLTPANSAGVFHPDGWLLWNREGTLTAQRLDLAQGVLTGEPIALADGVLGRASVTSTGLIAYRTGSETGRQLTWVDRTGTVLGTIGERDDAMFSPRLSPDGHRAAVYRLVQSNGDVWLLDGARTSRFTFDAAADTFPLWSPDGSRIVFRSARSGTSDFFLKSTDGAGEETMLLSTDQIKTPSSWSADGRFLIYHSIGPETARDLWAVPMTADPVPFIVLQTPFQERSGVLSPDSRWITYESDESGRYEVYVRAFLTPDALATGTAAVGGQWQVSTEGGSDPVWSPDGQELFYLDPEANMMAAPLSVTGDRVEVGAPAVLFSTRIFGGGDGNGNGRQYDVAADGRFLINTLVDEGSTTPITLILNWNPEAVQ